MIITLYSKPLCPYCDGAEHYLKKNGFNYNKIDVTENAEAMEFIKGKGHRTVPQIYKDGKLLVEGGFQGLKKQSDEFFCSVENEFVPKLNDEHVGYAWIDSGTWPKPMHPGLWSTINFDAVKYKIETMEQQVQTSA